MKLTNKFGYHEVVVRAIRNDTYSKGDSEFSATGLIQPARIRALSLRHADELESDVDDEVFKLYGHLGHSILERSGDQIGALTEKRLFAEIADTKISAQIDSLSLIDGTLTDWKFTTVFGFMKGTKPKDEWVWQLNIQHYLLQKNGFDNIKKLEIVGLLRDWRPAESKKNPDYPKKVASHNIPFFPQEFIEEYIAGRIAKHRESDQTLPRCTPDENWRGNRCKGYCPVSNFCDQHKETI